MSTTETDTVPSVPAAPWGQRWAVEHRPSGSRRWAVVVTAGSERLAWDAAFDLMQGCAGDWRVTPLPDDANAAPSGSAVGSGAGTRQART